MRIENITVRTIETPVIRNIEVPVTRPTVPVTRGLRVPIIRVPQYEYEYPVLNIPPGPIEFETDEPVVGAPAAEPEVVEEIDTRDLPTPAPEVPVAEVPVEEVPTGPTVTIPGTDIDVNLPDPSVVATAGAVAIVTTATTIVANLAFNQIKDAATPVIKNLIKKKFKVKLKNIKPVLHFVQSDNGMVDVFEYSAKGTKLVAQTDKVEQYLRDQVEINPLYELDNKVIVDESIKNKFTKEGAKRFKNLFAPAKAIAKKLSAKFSI